jgi:hypothetical protein
LAGQKEGRGCLARRRGVLQTGWRIRQSGVGVNMIRQQRIGSPYSPPRDVVTVTRIDRRARSTSTCSASQAHRRRESAVRITGRAAGRHRHQHRAVDYTVLGGLADVERDLIRTRTAERKSRQGPRAAHVPPRSLQPAQHKEGTRRRAQGALRCRNWRIATTAAFPPFARATRPARAHRGSPNPYASRRPNTDKTGWRMNILDYSTKFTSHLPSTVMK